MVPPMTPMHITLFGIGVAMRTRAKVYNGCNIKGANINLDSGALKCYVETCINQFNQFLTPR